MVSWNKGSAGAAITLKGRTGDIVTIAVADGSNYTWTHIFGINNVTYQNLRFTGGALAAMNIRTGTGVSFADVTFTSAGGHGFYIDAAMTTLTMLRVRAIGSTGSGGFFNADVTGTVTDSSFNSNGSYGVQGKLGGITWTNNYFDYNGSHGFCSDQATSGAVVTGGRAIDNCTDYPTCAAGNRRHGYVFANGHTGFSISRVFGRGDLGLDIQATSGSNSGIVTNSIFIGKGSGQGTYGTGILIGALNASYNDNVQIYNSTSVSEHASGAGLYVEQYVNVASIAKNNIFVNSAGGAAYLVDTAAPYITTNYNDYYSSGTIFSDKGTGRTFAGWKSASSQDSNSIVSNPLIDSYYSPSISSPACGKGLNALVLIDYNGRPFRNPPAIGAYECRGRQTMPNWLRFGR
jgi:hypothetical protein